MALRDQPYLPLYIQDYLTDEKLNECCAATQGVYIKIMCILHKSEYYGKILLKQKDKQNASKISDFANKLARLLPFTYSEIESALIELIDEGVMKIDGDTLYQKRMVKDGEISEKRAFAASCNSKRASKNSAKGLAKHLANSENENEYEYEDNIDNESENEGTISGKKKSAKEAAKENLNLYREQIEMSALSDSLKEKMQEWLTYKNERKDNYAPTGFNSLLTKITNRVNQKGDQYVLSSIDNSMANNWKGIIWDKESAQKPQPKDWMDIDDF